MTVMKQDPSVRFSGFLVEPGWDYWNSLGLKPDNKGEFLRINGIKCWADGSIQGGSAYLREPYTIEGWGRGAPNYSQE